MIIPVPATHVIGGSYGELCVARFAVVCVTPINTIRSMAVVHGMASRDGDWAWRPAFHGYFPTRHPLANGALRLSVVVDELSPSWSFAETDCKPRETIVVQVDVANDDGDGDSGGGGVSHSYKGDNGFAGVETVMIARIEACSISIAHEHAEPYPVPEMMRKKWIAKIGDEDVALR